MGLLLRLLVLDPALLLLRLELGIGDQLISIVGQFFSAGTKNLKELGTCA